MGIVVMEVAVKVAVAMVVNIGCCQSQGNAVGEV